MKNIDISRDSFDPLRNRSRVLLQQGRVQLDADWNEQTAIAQRAMRLMMLDLVGPAAGPDKACGFMVLTVDEDLPHHLDDEDKHVLTQMLGQCAPGDFILSKGRYYINGLLCENHAFVHYSHQARAEHRERGITEAGRYLVFLDVIEREITALEDDSIREVALGGPDTAVRMELAWVVRTLPLKVEEDANDTYESLQPPWRELVLKWQPHHRGALKARALEPAQPTDESSGGGARNAYRGPENQLYRIEIHQGGTCDAPVRPTFKFSRDNGIVAYAIAHISDDGTSIVLRDWGADDRAVLRSGDYVELTSPWHDLRGPHGREGHTEGHAGKLLRVASVDPANRLVTLNEKPDHVPPADAPRILRRWDQQQGDPKKGGLQLVDGAALLVEDRWLTLEDGVMIMFQKLHACEYRSGDYWLVPARTATRDVVWPKHGHDGEPVAQPPHGVEHYFAPLAIVDVDQNQTSLVVPLTRTFGYRALEGSERDVLTRG